MKKSIIFCWAGSICLAGQKGEPSLSEIAKHADQWHAFHQQNPGSYPLKKRDEYFAKASDSNQFGYLLRQRDTPTLVELEAIKEKEEESKLIKKIVLSRDGVFSLESKLIKSENPFNNTKQHAIALIIKRGNDQSKTHLGFTYNNTTFPSVSTENLHFLHIPTHIGQCAWYVEKEEKPKHSSQYQKSIKDNAIHFCDTTLQHSVVTLSLHNALLSYYCQEKFVVWGDILIRILHKCLSPLYAHRGIEYKCSIAAYEMYSIKTNTRIAEGGLIEVKGYHSINYFQLEQNAQNKYRLGILKTDFSDQHLYVLDEETGLFWGGPSDHDHEPRSALSNDQTKIVSVDDSRIISLIQFTDNQLQQGGFLIAEGKGARFVRFAPDDKSFFYRQDYGLKAEHPGHALYEWVLDSNVPRKIADDKDYFIKQYQVFDDGTLKICKWGNLYNEQSKSYCRETKYEKMLFPLYSSYLHYLKEKEKLSSDANNNN